MEQNREGISIHEPFGMVYRWWGEVRWGENLEEGKERCIIKFAVTISGSHPTLRLFHLTSNIQCLRVTDHHARTTFPGKEPPKTLSPSVWDKTRGTWPFIFFRAWPSLLFLQVGFPCFTIWFSHSVFIFYFYSRNK